MLIIDTHAHIYSPDEAKYPAIEDPLRPPAGKGSLEDLKQESRANGVSAICAIQTSTFYRFDNRYILDSSKANPGLVAGVCTLNPDNPRSPSLLVRNVREYGIRGMRSISGLRQAARPSRRARSVEDGSRRGNRDQRPHGSAALGPGDRLLGQFPRCESCSTTVSTQGRTGPGIHRRESAVPFAPRELACQADVRAYRERDGFPCADLHDACMRIAKAFGAERCVWGSDYPNGLWTPNVSYAEHLKIFTEVLPFSEQDREAVLGSTARRLWFPNL